MKLRNFTLAFLAAAILAACSDGKFEISGTIEGADNASVVLEKADYSGYWQPVDSARTDAKGRFSIRMDAPAAPEIYRLAYGSEAIYVPVDSIDHIKIETNSNAFASQFTMTGTPEAEKMAWFEKELRRVAAINNPDSMAQFKRRVFAEVISAHRAGILSYYILTKTIDDRPLYDLDDPTDTKYYAAVATAYREFKPSDPHTKLLESASLEALRRRNAAAGRSNVVQANEVALFEIELPDTQGNTRRLSEVTSAGKPTVLIFSLLTHAQSPEINRRLAQIYNAAGGRVNFFQVSYDPDQYDWRDAAKNLPWVNVYDVAGENSQSLVDYNVTMLPSFYIFNSKGELSAKATDFDDLARKLANY